MTDRIDLKSTLALIQIAKQVLTDPKAVADDFATLAESVLHLKDRTEPRLIDITRAACCIKLVEREGNETRSNEVLFAVLSIVYCLGILDAEKSYADRLENS